MTPSGVQYVTVDHLGSTRVRTNGAGAVVKRSDYLPFGEEIGSGTGGRGSDYTAGVAPTTDASVAPDSLLFTGKLRDAETGLDYFGARYYSGAQGRWTTADWSPMPQAVPYADLSDPQTLNLYGYVRNNPLSKTDPDGHADGFWSFAADYWTGVGKGWVNTHVEGGTPLGYVMKGLGVQPQVATNQNQVGILYANRAQNTPA